MRMSALNFAALAAMPLTTPSTCASTFREYVCPVTGIDVRRSPIAAVTSRSSSRTLRVVAVEQLEEARLRAGRALHAAERQRRDAVLEVREVEHQVLHPQRRALADGRRLRGLEVRVAERRLVAPLARERRERAQHAHAR